MAKSWKWTDPNLPVWFDGTNINEAVFCDEFLSSHKIIYSNRASFTPDGRVTDDLPLRGEIFERLKCCAVNNIPRKVSNILEVMKLAAQVDDFPPLPDRIHLSNGTLMLDGSFIPGKPEIVRSRLPVAYNQDAPKPEQWLSFLDGLLYPEDIVTLQEFIGYCLIPCNKGQRMMVIKGNGGEGKSQIGAVLGSLFGTNMKDGSIGKISENRFARADLEHILLCVDDDMRMEALRQTNYVKSIVTAQGKMDLERKGKQSYQGWMFARLLAFSKRLSAKEIVGNKKKLTWWQDEFWKHMVKKYPDLERGESASQTGRDHIPPRVFKEMTRLTKQKEKLEGLLAGISPFNAKSRAEEIGKLLDGYIPAVEKMQTLLTKYNVAFTKTAAENKRLKKKNSQLAESLDAAQEKSVLKKLQDCQLRRDYEAAISTLERIPPEVLDWYTQGDHARKERPIEEVL